MNHLKEKFEKWKIEREVNEHNESYAFREGYVKAMCDAINQVKNLSLGNVTKRLYCFDYIGNSYVEDGEIVGDIMTERVEAYDKEHAISIFKNRFVNVPFDEPY